MRTALLVLSLVVCARAQTFDVASVKPSPPYAMGQRMLTVAPGRITFNGAPLSSILMQAYDLWFDQIEGPAWISDFNSAYSITATMPAGTTKEQWRVMLQNLLTERFRLRVHQERQTRPGYELVVAEGGHKLRPWKPAPGSMDEKTLRFISPMSGAGRLHIRTQAELRAFCRVLGGAINMSNGISAASGPLARIVDRTGLEGVYEFNLEFNGVFSTTSTQETLDQLASDPGPTVFMAVEKQLGLVLRKTKGVTVDVLVIEHADRIPTEN